MADRNLLVTVEFPDVLTGLPADSVFNTWHFFEKDGDGTDAIATALDNFYNNAASGSPHPLAYYINGSRDRGAEKTLIRFYELPAAPGPIGSPIETAFVTLGAGSTHAALPSEVAAVMSFHSDLTGVAESTGTTRPAMRHRNRVYLGPLEADSIVTDDGSAAEIFLSSNFLETVTHNAANLFLYTGASGNSFWGQWSKADWTMRKVTGGYVDNAPDTQRRRGEKATARTALSTS